MTVRIVVTGPECTGKTTLAAQLADALPAPWVEEASRRYAEDASREGRQLRVHDVWPIARRQMAAEDAVIAGGAPVVVLDTDLISTVVYAGHYYGLVDPSLEQAARERRGALYLLCRPDVPWIADRVRDRPLNRDQLFDQFAETLDAFRANVRMISGFGAARLAAALREVDRLPGLGKAISNPRAPTRS